MLTDLISHGKIPSKIAIGNDISRMRMLLGLNEFPQTPFLNGIGGFLAMFFAYKNPIESKLAIVRSPLIKIGLLAE